MLPASMLALLALAALVTTGPTARRLLGLVIALPAFLSPFAAATPMPRAFLAAGAFWGFARLVDLVRETRTLGPLRRLGHVFAIVDSRQVAFIPPRLDLRSLARATLGGLGAYLALWTGVSLAPELGSTLLRWLAGCGLIYGFAECLAGLLLFVGRLLGADPPPIHRHPILARSLRDFWGERWNIVVGRWLRHHCFNPLARRGRAGAGLALAFAVSVALHVWIVAAALDRDMALQTSAFFALQGALLAVEGRLGVPRWPRPLGRAWALACTILPSPLFTEPLLRIFAELVAPLAWV